MSKGLKIFGIVGALTITVFAGITFIGQKTKADQSMPLKPPSARVPLSIPPPINTVGRFERSELLIQKQDGEVLNFSIELAKTPQQQSQGLMFRTEMSEDAGMLFLFPESAMRSFWMKNTLIALDMLFLGEDGEILHIHENAVPRDLTGVSSTVPAKAVLEINGGVSAKKNIQIGDRIIHESFGNAQKD